jgi:hypothetical protein
LNLDPQPWLKVLIFYETIKTDFFVTYRPYMEKMVTAGAEIFDNREQEPDKKRPAPQHLKQDWSG